MFMCFVYKWEVVKSMGFEARRLLPAFGFSPLAIASPSISSGFRLIHSLPNSLTSHLFANHLPCQTKNSVEPLDLNHTFKKFPKKYISQKHYTSDRPNH